MIGIESEAYYLPKTKKKVQDILVEEDIPFGTLSKNIDFKRDLGIEEVHVTEEYPSTVALKAVRDVISKTGITGREIDVIIDFTSIPEDYIGPTWSAAGFIQKEINANRAFSTAVTLGGCASYHFAMKAAYALMSAEVNIKRILLFAGDRTPNLNKTYYPITVASDGGSAFILKKECDRAVILAIDTISVGRLHDVWYVPGLGNRQNDDKEHLEKLIHMYCDMGKFNDGVIMINFIMFNRIIQRILGKVGIKLEEIDLFIYPTFSTWDQDYFFKSTGIQREKVYTKKLIERGHVQESDMVINYCDAVNDGSIKKGDIIMVLTNGAGFAWSAAIIRH